MISGLLQKGLKKNKIAEVDQLQFYHMSSNFFSQYLKKNKKKHTDSFFSVVYFNLRVEMLLKTLPLVIN